MRPFFRFYGQKWTAARWYGPPRCKHVIEVFGGGLGYSLFWASMGLMVTLIEIDPVIYAIWVYLQRVSAAEIMRLPSNVFHVDELPSRVPQEARWLIGFWFDSGLTKPSICRSNWARVPSKWGNYWSENAKRLIASQLNGIRHWTVIHDSWENAPNYYGHWHIDPPYSCAAGRQYTFNEVDYALLADFCRSRRGFVQVCEQAGATWLDFQPIGVVKTHRGRGYSVEAVCEIDNRRRRRPK